MKEHYITPEVEIIVFYTEDVITASGEYGEIELPEIPLE